MSRAEPRSLYLPDPRLATICDAHLLAPGEHVFRPLFDHAERQSAPPGELCFTMESGRATRNLFRFGVMSREFIRDGRA